MRFRIPTSRLDAASIVTATTIAGLGAAGVRVESLPLERMGESADLVAGAFAFCHYLHGRRHSHTQDATVTTTITEE